MAVSIIMPKAGMAMETGTVLRWLKSPGDTVAKGEALLEIETDKVSMEVEAEVSGVLLLIVRDAGEVVPVTETVGYLGEPGETVAESAEGETDFAGDFVRMASPQSPSAGPMPNTDTPVPDPSTHGIPPAAVGRTAATPAARRLARRRRLDLAAIRGTGPRGAVHVRDVEAFRDVKASPVAKRLAERSGVSLTDLQGTGPGGRITKADVLAPAPEDRIGKAAGRQGSGAARSAVSRIMAERMLRSHREIPPVTLQGEADVTELLALREPLNRGRRRRISLNDFVLFAAARALRNRPSFRASLVEERIVVHPHVNIGMAVALEEGLIVPVIEKADTLSLEELSAAARRLADKARSGGLSIGELEGAVFTVTNLGMYGVTAFNPIINPPQCAIMGVCAVRNAAVPAGDGVVFRKRMTLALTIDHRVLDGARGALFLKAVIDMLENPSAMAGEKDESCGKKHD